VLQMFNKCNEIDREKFSETVIDLLVQLKEFSENSDELYQQMKQVSHLTLRKQYRKLNRRWQPPNNLALESIKLILSISI